MDPGLRITKITHLRQRKLGVPKPLPLLVVPHNSDERHELLLERRQPLDVRKLGTSLTVRLDNPPPEERKIKS